MREHGNTRRSPFGPLLELLQLKHIFSVRTISQELQLHSGQHVVLFIT